jgi:hypothetical protein
LFVVVVVPDTDPPQVYVYVPYPPDAVASQVTGIPVVVLPGDTEQFATRGGIEGATKFIHPTTSLPQA